MTRLLFPHMMAAGASGAILPNLRNLSFAWALLIVASAVVASACSASSSGDGPSFGPGTAEPNAASEVEGTAGAPHDGHTEPTSPTSPDTTLPSTQDTPPSTGGGGDGCQLGDAGSFATDEDLDIFGEVVYFADARAVVFSPRTASFFRAANLRTRPSPTWTAPAPG